MLTPLAVVTGATGGIGAAISYALCGAGFSVLLVGRNSEQLQQLREQLANQFHQVAVYALSCDITSVGDRATLVENVRTLEHPLQLWVNNAGISHFGLFHEQSASVVEAQVNVNVTATLLLTQALLKVVDHTSSLQIINVGSTFGTIGYPGFCAYSASKFALRGFSEALSRELSDSAIRVRYFAPRATKTLLNSSAVEAMNAELKVAMDTPEIVAKAFMAFIAKPTHSHHLGFPEKLFVRLNALVPKVISGAIAKQLSVIKRHASAS